MWHLFHCLTNFSVVAEAQRASEVSSSSDGSILTDSDDITEGPLRLYLDGRKSGLYRPDPRQETTIKLLQDLYDQLKRVHVGHKRPSGLTTTDHIGAGSPRHSWYASAALQCTAACWNCMLELQVPTEVVPSYISRVGVT